MSLVTRGLGRPGNFLVTGGLGRRLIRVLTGKGGVTLTQRSSTPSLNRAAQVGIVVNPTEPPALSHSRQSAIDLDSDIAAIHKPVRVRIESDTPAETELKSSGFQVSEGAAP